MAMDLHLECPVTLRIKDKRRNPLKRQKRVEEDVVHQGGDDTHRRTSHSCSPRMPSQTLKDNSKGGSAQQLPTHYPHCPSSGVKRRSSNASDCTHRSRTRRRDCPHTRGRLERAISSDSRLTGAIPKCYHHHHTSAQTSTEQEPGGSSSDTDIRRGTPHAVLQFGPQ